MTDNVAILDGYTEEVYCEYAGMTFNLLVKPETELDQRFKAWDINTQEYIYVNGWLADNLNYC